MLGDGEGLQSEIKFAVAATYDKFSEKWDIAKDKLQWVALWSSVLDRFSVAEINTVADYCIKEFRRPPVPVEYIELCTRIRNKKSLSEPIVSKIERMAYLILANEDFKVDKISNSEVSDACLIAAVIASLNMYAEVLPSMKTESILEEMTGRVRMFFAEALRWQLDAKEGKGYWADSFYDASDRT